jgi:hypothetical protein
LEAVIRKCLSASPDSRPDALEFLNEICIELKKNFSLDIARTLELWRSGAAGDDNVAKNEQFAWAAKQSPRLGATDAEVSRNQLSDKLRKIDVVDFKSCEEWAPLAEAFVHLTAVDNDERRHIRTLASEHLIKMLGALGSNEVAQLGARSDWPTLRPFERYEMLASTLSAIAALGADERSSINERLGSYAKSALIYSSASKLRSMGENQAAIEMLSGAIAEAPSEPTLYYFRARWTHEARLLRRMLAAKSVVMKPSEIEDIADDLNKAISFEPDWEEPRRLLNKLRE